MADPSSADPSHHHSDSLPKQLQLLQTENTALRQQRQSFELTLRKYLKTINQLDEQLQLEKKAKETLQMTNRQYGLKCRRLELDLQRANEEYRNLYNQVHLTQQLGPRQSMSRQMELINQLHQIQQNSLAQSMSNMKIQLEKKNGEVVKLYEENTKLKQNILNSTHEYHQKIIKLREQIAVLEVENKNKGERILPQGKGQQEVHMTHGDRLYEAKIQALEHQVKILQRQYERLSQQLLTCKKQLVHFKHESQWLKITLQTQSSKKQTTINYQQIQQIIEQNVDLKRRLDQEHVRLNILVDNHPNLLNQLEEIDLTNPLEELQVQLEKLTHKYANKEKQLTKVKQTVKDVTSQKKQKEQQFIKFKSTAVKTIDKLKRLVSTHVPCVGLYGFQEFGLQEQQTKFVQSNSTDVYKQYDKLASAILNFKDETEQAKEQLRQANHRIQRLQLQIEEEVNKNLQMKEENRKLLASIESLSQRCAQLNQSYQQQTVYQPYQGQEEEQQVEEEAIVEQESERVVQSPPDRSRTSQIRKQQEKPLSKVDFLCDLIEQLQKDRISMLEVVRSKDFIIAQANAQLNVLRSTCQPKIYTFDSLFSQPLAITQSAVPTFQNNSQQQQQVQKQTEDYEKLRKQISTMSQLYETQVNLLEQEHNKKYSDLSLKYAHLLAEKHELQRNYDHLQKMYEANKQKGEEVHSNHSQPINEEQAQAIEHQGLLPRDEKNVISEATIQIISDILKKYEKQFNRFSNIFESQLTKAKELTKNHYQQLDHKATQEQLTDSLKKVEDLVAKKEETIVVLQEELKHNYGLLEAQKEQYEQEQTILKDRIAQLENRIEAMNSDLQGILQKLSKETVVEGEEGEINQKSANFLFATFRAKDQQIQSLRQTVKEKETIVQHFKVVTNDLQKKLQDQRSELQKQQYQMIKGLVQSGQLAYVMDKLGDYIQHQKQKDKKMHEEL